MGGGTTTTKERPGALDFLNADVVTTLAPFLMQNVAADLGGGMTANKSDAINQAVTQGLMQGASPGTSQMFANINKSSQPSKQLPGNVLQMAGMLYGKQPSPTGGGGSTTVTPGTQDYANAMLNLYKVYNAFPSGNNTTSAGNNAYDAGGGYYYTMP